MSTTLTSVGKKLLDNLPFPLASAWGLVLRAPNSSEQVRQCWAVLDIFLRYSAGIVLQAYLRGPKNDAVEELIKRMERPSNGHYCALIRETLRTFREQEDSFVSHIVEWYYTSKGKPSDQARLLDELISERNKDAHGMVRTEKELKEIAKSLVFRFQTLLHKSKWLFGYGLFRVSSTKLKRRGGQTGKIHSYIGDSSSPIPKDGTWSSNLFPEAVYVSRPKGDQFLEVSPLFHIEVYGRKEQFFLWVSTPKGKRIELRCDDSGEDKKLLPTIDETDIPFNAWLSRREELDPIIKNSQTEDFFAAEFQEIGKLIGDRYRIEEKLGSGGMATVYLVQDELMDERVALKILHLEQVDTTVRERTKLEFRMMKSLRHPHILSMKSIDVLSDGRVALSMPLMKGTLKDLASISPIRPDQIQKWATQILEALDYLHQKESPIFHRDIKPSNLLYDENKDVFLSDFGIARQEGDVRLTRTAEQMGSLPYMAPELLLGTPAGPSSDRYALAVSLHELLLGRIPKKVGKDIDGDFGGFLRQLASKDPEERMKAQWPMGPTAEELKAQRREEENRQAEERARIEEEDRKQQEERARIEEEEKKRAEEETRLEEKRQALLPEAQELQEKAQSLNITLSPIPQSPSDIETWMATTAVEVAKAMRQAAKEQAEEERLQREEAIKREEERKQEEQPEEQQIDYSPITNATDIEALKEGYGEVARALPKSYWQERSASIDLFITQTSDVIDQWMQSGEPPEEWHLDVSNLGSKDTLVRRHIKQVIEALLQDQEKEREQEEERARIEEEEKKRAEEETRLEEKRQALLPEAQELQERAQHLNIPLPPIPQSPSDIETWMSMTAAEVAKAMAQPKASSSLLQEETTESKKKEPPTSSSIPTSKDAESSPIEQKFSSNNNLKRIGLIFAALALVVGGFFIFSEQSVEEGLDEVCIALKKHRDLDGLRAFAEQIDKNVHNPEVRDFLTSFSADSVHPYKRKDLLQSFMQKNGYNKKCDLSLLSEAKKDEGTGLDFASDIDAGSQRLEQKVCEERGLTCKEIVELHGFNTKPEIIIAMMEQREPLTQYSKDTISCLKRNNIPSAIVTTAKKLLCDDEPAE